jgi:hypothetical protein
VSQDETTNVGRAVIGAINNRTPRLRAAEFIDPAFVRHDLVEVFPDSRGPGGASDFVGMITAAMPDFRLEIADIHALLDTIGPAGQRFWTCRGATAGPRGHGSVVRVRFVVYAPHSDSGVVDHCWRLGTAVVVVTIRFRGRRWSPRTVRRVRVLRTGGRLVVGRHR